MNLIVFNLVCNVDPFPEISFHAFLRPKGQFLNLAQNALCENVRHFDEESLIVWKEFKKKTNENGSLDA